MKKVWLRASTLCLLISLLISSSVPAFAASVPDVETHSWVKSTSIGDIGHNFAVNAKAQINYALSSSTYATATRNALPKAQRNCAVVIYKFLVDVGAVR